MTTLKKIKIKDTPFAFRVHSTWYKWLDEAGLLGSHFTKQMQALLAEVKEKGETMWPAHTRWLAAFEDDPDRIRVVLLGQDPYPTPHRATGHSFEIAGSADDSLRTIYAAILTQYPQARIDPDCGDLSHWRSQGVLLLNAALSVCGSRSRHVIKEGKPVIEDRPRKVLRFWSRFTRGALRVLCEKRPYLVFLLWGRDAANFHTQQTGPIKGDHGVIMSYHPSELAKTVKNPGKPPLRLFRQIDHFRLANQLLLQHQVDPIDWSTLQP